MSSTSNSIQKDTKGQLIEQFVSRVLDCSSQYGSSRGFSYAALNIIGKPTVFPSYGDYAATYAPRTYGPWWQEEYAIYPPIAPHHASSTISSSDFIELEFEKPVFPSKIYIYETYNPGSVVRIWCGNSEGRWQLLYESEPCYVGHNSRIFSPCLRKARFPVKLVRLEFSSLLSDYYPEFDAVLLAGTLEEPLEKGKLQFDSIEITEKVLELKLHLIPNTDVVATWKNFEKELQNIIKSQLRLNLVTEYDNPGYTLEALPVEVIRHILELLDLRSLCAISRTSRSLKEAASDPLLYSAVNLQPYWNVATNATLLWLADRAIHLQRLDLSWCGQHNKISPSEFQSFMKKFGPKLRVLRLSNCGFVTEECLKTLSRCCPLLEVLDLDGLEANISGCWSLANLVNLRRLVLDRSTVEIRALISILQSNPCLEHLSLDSCIYLENIDEICIVLQQHNRNLQSLNVWRGKYLSTVGLVALSTLSSLQDLDLGWCSGLPANGGNLCQLISSIPHLRKLFLTAVRIVTDTELITLATYCKELELLDLLGSSSITPNAVYRVLCCCPFLKLLDISYCGLIREDHVNTWREQFSHVSIKYSLSPEAINSVPNLAVE